MRVLEITESIWSNCQEIAFGNSSSWDDDTFKKGWFTKNEIENKWDSGSSGWYWFICNTSHAELHDIGKPASLPKSGCNFGLVLHENLDTFSEENLYASNDNKLVVYNGHENNVMSRIRAHFYLNNNNTGALGIKHYPLSNKEWSVKVFTQNLIVNLPEDIQGQVRKLLNNRTGRGAIESAWRVKYGWPILCKH